MMVTVGVEQNFQRHAEIPGCLPWVSAPLHQPRRRGVPEGMRRDSGIEPSELYSALERRFDRGHRLAVELDEVLRLGGDSVPSLQIAQAGATGSAPSVAACWSSRLPAAGDSIGRALGRHKTCRCGESNYRALG
jgi:hypothetical protein